jgi:hypothetical protein
VGLLWVLTSTAALVGVPGIRAVGVMLIASGFFVLLMLSATYQVYTQQDRLVFSRVLGGRD